MYNVGYACPKIAQVSNGCRLTVAVLLQKIADMHQSRENLQAPEHAVSPAGTTRAGELFLRLCMFESFCNTMIATDVPGQGGLAESTEMVRKVSKPWGLCGNSIMLSATPKPVGHVANVAIQSHPWLWLPCGSYDLHTESNNVPACIPKACG